jgi:hypothetical protein
MSDRITRIFADQIEDHSLTAEELDIENIVTAKKNQILMLKNDTTGQFYFAFAITGQIFK